MSDDLTNQIALLCDIGELHLLKAYRRSELEQLISGGYVGRTESHARSAFMLTAKGVEFLGKRGAGLNEGVDLHYAREQEDRTIGSWLCGELNPEPLPSPFHLPGRSGVIRFRDRGG